MSTPLRPSRQFVLRPIGLALVAVALAAVALAGCGGGGSTTSTGGAQKRIDSTPISLSGGAHAVWGKPAGGGSPKELVVLVHGGSWAGLSPSTFRAFVATATVFQGLGFETLTVDYRRGALGIKDVDALYQIARRRVGPRLPICAVGVSAGAQIALELAIHNPDLACVIDLAGPSNLPGLARDPHGAGAYQIALGAFGRSLLGPLSPALHAASIKAKLLLIYARNDPLVPVTQGYDMKRADPSARLIVLPPGSAPFVHTGIGASAQASGVSASAYAAAQKDEVSFLNAAAGG